MSSAERLNAEAQQAFAARAGPRPRRGRGRSPSQLDAAREEAERIRAAEAEAVRERAAVETQLKAELERLRFVTTQTRKADESETRSATTDQAARSRARAVRAKAEDRKGELEELRAQMAEMREAAAQHARAAAAEAVAAEVARTAARPTPSSRSPRQRSRDRRSRAPERPPTRDEVPRRPDYLSSLSRPTPQPVPADSTPQTDDRHERRGKSWRRSTSTPCEVGAAVAACLLLVTNTGTAISTVCAIREAGGKTGAHRPARDQEEPPFIEVVEKRVGAQDRSTPPGAEAILDGKSYGRTPLTIPDLDVGLHTLVLKSGAGTITRRVTIKPNQTTLLTEAIFSGWLAIFSPIPVSVEIDGTAGQPHRGRASDDDPGRHVVEFISEQFNYRATETLDVRRGDDRAHPDAAMEPSA